MPSPLHHVNEYVSTLPEIAMALGLWATGLLTLTVLYKKRPSAVGVGVKEETAA